MKFGGSSLGNSDCIKRVLDIAKNQSALKPVIVVSAMGDTTDDLIECGKNAIKGTADAKKIIKFHAQACEELNIDFDFLETLTEELESLLLGIRLVGELTPRTKDALLSFGERLAARIVARYFDQAGLPAEFFDSWEMGMITNDRFGDARPISTSHALIQEQFKKKSNWPKKIPIITGFIGRTESGQITTLGRGGSDFTATALGASLKAKEIQVWKDVSGLHTANPSLIKDAKPVGNITYEEAAELASFGASILHPRCIGPAKNAKIPVRILNTFDPKAEGTCIGEKVSSQQLARSMTSQNKITSVEIHSLQMAGESGFLRKIFAAFESADVSVNMITTSEVSVSVTLEGKIASTTLNKLKSELESFSQPHFKSNQSMITIITSPKNITGVLSKASQVAQKLNTSIDMLSIGISQINLSFLVSEHDCDAMMKELHKQLF